MKKNDKKKYSFNRRPSFNKGPQNLLMLLGVILGSLLILSVLSEYMRNIISVPYSSFAKRLEQGDIKRFDLNGQEVQGEFRDNSRFETVVPQGANFERIVKQHPEVEINVASPSNGYFWYGLLLLGLLAGMGGAWFFSRRSSKEGGGIGGSGNIFSMGKSRARMFLPSEIKVNFDSVAGAHAAKEELKDVVSFLKDPEKYQRLGAKIARGVLMVGAPGNGKTLLARAIAGEANCPFFSISGSDFMEVFVGVGASRVRDLFKQARKRAPSIIFIDEIDAIGRHRGSGMGGGHDEREQTLNQLLIEMDGFETDGGSVIIIAATNRPDVLDKALLRPGRFDRRVHVPYPDLASREQILAVHAKNYTLDPSVDLKILARGTSGFSGADLASLINEAAVIATKKGSKSVVMQDFDSARDKITIGAENKSIIQTPEDLKLTAYHEAGHTLVNVFLPREDTMPLEKVTIVPRGGALGVTHSLPERDKPHQVKSEILANIAIACGGRAAEQISMGQVSTGAGSDYQYATDQARRMVCQLGMSDVGTAIYAQGGGSFRYSEKMSQRIDEEVQKILDSCYATAETIITNNRDKLDVLTNALLEKETLLAHEVYELLGLPVRESNKIV